jgi:hypothetical protein
MTPIASLSTKIIVPKRVGSPLTALSLRSVCGGHIVNIPKEEIVKHEDENMTKLLHYTYIFQPVNKPSLNSVEKLYM